MTATLDNITTVNYIHTITATPEKKDSKLYCTTDTTATQDKIKV